jgi:predicted RNase H-like HicB family nuclease
MIREYLDAAVSHAVYKKLEDSGEIFGEIPPCPGVWATGTTPEECRKTLEEALEGWILLGIRMGDSMPVIDGKRLDVPESVTLT